MSLDEIEDIGYCDGYSGSAKNLWWAPPGSISEVVYCVGWANGMAEWITDTFHGDL